MKPTYGTVSRYGLIAYGSSLDQIGPITKDVTDCATVLEAIASYDAKDSTSVKESLRIISLPRHSSRMYADLRLVFREPILVRESTRRSRRRCWLRQRCSRARAPL